MKNICIVGCFAALITFCMPSVLAANTLRDIIKIGIVDMGRIFEEYANRSEEARQIREKREQLNREVREEVAAIRRLESNLRERMHDISDAERRRRSAEIEFRRDEIANYLARRNSELDREEADIAGPMREDIRASIRFVANRMGIKLVFDTRHVAWNDFELDITEAVLARLRLVISQRS